MLPEFDMQAAREIASRTGTIPCSSKAVFLAALDEIERLRGELATANTHLMGAGQIEVIHEKRIAELESDVLEYRVRRKEFAGRLAKQRAALEILGKRSAKRGKALVEERAATIAYENNMQLCECKEFAMCQARRQLRQEGLL